MSRNRLYILVLVLAILAYGLVFFNVFHIKSTNTIPSLCVIKNITGIPCPACGTTRSVTQIALGNFKSALTTNPLGYIATLLLIFSPFFVIADLIQKRNRFLNLYQKAENLLKIKWVSVLSIALILANWIWNIYKEL